MSVSCLSFMLSDLELNNNYFICVFLEVILLMKCHYQPVHCGVVGFFNQKRFFFILILITASHRAMKCNVYKECFFILKTANVRLNSSLLNFLWAFL